MIPEIGHFALILALSIALVQVSVLGFGVIKRDSALMTVSQTAPTLQCVLTTLSFMALGYTFLANDHTVWYVARHSNPSIPAIYRLCAIWGGHEGSVLLWVWILSVWQMAVSRWRRQALDQRTQATMLLLLALINTGFYVFLLVTSNPFTRVFQSITPQWMALNPLLQDPGLAIHPPLLYMGYVGFAVVFAFALTALLYGKLDQQWARWARPWTLAAWSFLTAGIIFGSWWAYRELGWGGFWFWDPVENASLLPWLVGTALVHSLMVAERRQLFKAWTVLLALCAFALSLLGTFLVRSGVLISVHAFAVDPQRGLYILMAFAAVVGGSLAIYAWRGRALASMGEFHWFAKESALLLNNVLLFIAMLTVLLGTLYPLIMAVMHIATLSVGAPYFNTVMPWLWMPLLALMGVAPDLRWRLSSWPMSSAVFWGWRIAAMLLVLALVLSGLMWLWPIKTGVRAWLLLMLVIWVGVNHILVRGGKRSVLRQWIRQGPMRLAHLGMAVTGLGLVVVSMGEQSQQVVMGIGDETKVGPYRVQLLGFERVQGDNYSATQARLRLTRQGQVITTLTPQQRYYPAAHTPLAKTAIAVRWGGDVYAAMGRAWPNQRWVFRFYYKPLIRLIWLGGLLMILGALWSLYRLCVQRRRGGEQRYA